MICSRCKKRLKKAYFHNGKVYGPECVVKVGGYIKSDKKIRTKETEENDKQMELF